MEQEFIQLQFGDLTYDVAPPPFLSVGDVFRWKMGYSLNAQKALEMMELHYAFFGQINRVNSIDAEEYVTREAIIRCSFGTDDIKLDTYEDHGIIAANEKPLMTCEDCQVNKNIYSFGTCKSTFNGTKLINNLPHPTEIGVSGVETTVKYRCLPILSKQWIQKEGNLSVSDWTDEKFVEALRSGAYLTCIYGGLITVKDIPVKGDPQFIPENARIIFYPDTVTGNLNGVKKILEPNINWYNYRGKDTATVDIDNKLYYRIAVGPKVLDPQYPDDGLIHDDDFDNWGNIRIDVHLILKEE